MNSLQSSAFNLAPPPTLQWQPVQIANFTAVAGRAYPCNTTSAAFTVTLPASATAGDQITLTDYAGTFGLNALTVNPNSLKIQGSTANKQIDVSGNSVQLVYVDATQGWIPYSGLTSIPFRTISAEFLLAAGGGSGGGKIGGGGGAGGLRTGAQNVGLNLPYRITIGAGGASVSSQVQGNNGSNSVFGAITSAGGGGGGFFSDGSQVGTAGSNGGSGGGGGAANPGPSSGGSGNSPYVSPSQGNNGGTGTYSSTWTAGGGGGSSGSGGNGTGASSGFGAGGAGTASTITGSSVTYAAGGAGNEISGASGTAGAANTGNGGKGGAYNAAAVSGAGGSGVAIIKIPSTNTATFSAGVTSSLSTAVAGFKIYTVTATSTTSETVTFS